MSSSPSSAVAAARRPLGRALRYALPAGGHLPPEVWARRHRWILRLLWFHIPVIIAFGAIQGMPLRHLLLAVTPIAVLAFGAAKLAHRPRWSAVVAAIGLATCSALLVHLANGSIEMHFHFFVMVGVMTLYQDWPPFLASLAYVIVHHSVVGTIAPESVFNHPAAQAHPLTWALVHGGFILAMSLVGVISWRMNETTQAHVLDRDDKLAQAQQIAGLGSWEWDVPTGLLTWSDQLFRLYGYEPGAFAPTFDDFMERVHHEDRPLVQSVLARTHETLEPFDYDFRALMPDGSMRWLHGQGEITEVDDGRPARIAGTAHDITARKLAEHDLEASRQASELIQHVAVAANQASTLDHAMQTGLTAVCEFTGWPVGQVHLVRDDGSGLRPAGIWHVAGEQYRAFRDLGLSSPVSSDGDLAGTVMRSRLPVWDAVTAEDPLLRAAADELGLNARCAVPVVAGDDVVAVLEFFAGDASAPAPATIALLENVGTQIGRVVERKRARDALAYQAHHDPLTELPNRTLFLDRLGQAMSQLDRRSTSLAVLFMDLDGFKVINDSLGHNAGDVLLVALAERLEAAVREGDTVARFGGDEFAILSTDLADESEAVLLAERIADALGQPFSMGDAGEYVVTASIGIAVARADGGTATPADLLRDADLAMYRAKEQGRAQHAIFDPSMHTAANERLALGSALHRAVDAGEFRLHYQPQVELGGDDSIVGVEALIRWEHPDRGLVSPADFVPVAENTGLIVPIGAWVMREACAQLGAWQQAGRPDLTMCVNVSARQLVDDAIVDVVEQALADSGVTPSTLCLEITESVLMEEPDHYADRLARLKALGVALSVDDFGTGYSSLAYLQRLPADYLKIDKSFVDELGAGTNAAPIVLTIIDLAHSLGLGVVAEGVENEVQAAVLTRLGCDQAQGFLYARPTPADVIGPMLGCTARLTPADA